MIIKFRVKLFATFVIFAAALLFFVLYYIYENITRLPLAITFMQLETGVAHAARQIDAEDVSNILSADQQISHQSRQKVQKVIDSLSNAPPYFGPRGMQKHLRRPIEMDENAAHKEMFIIVKAPGENTARVLVSTIPENVGRKIDITANPALLSGWEEITVDKNIRRSDTGQIMYSYAPLKDSAGSTHAVLCLSAQGQFIALAHQNIFYRTMTIFAVAVITALFPAFYLARRLNRPIRRLHQGMEKVSQGQLDTRLKPLRSHDEFELLISHFNQMTAGLAEREKMKRSLALAMEIQQYLLPQQAPRIANFEIAGQSKYCDETGGDYYDFIELKELGPDKVGIALGDITGHGIGAALLMASARAVLRSQAVTHGADLPRIFDGINRHLVRDTDERWFMTLFYGIIDGPGRAVTWTSAGHDPAFWFRRELNRIEELPHENSGLPLGITEATDYNSQGPITLQTGDVLLVGTDGIWEAKNPAGEQFGKGRLRHVLESCSTEPALKIRSTIIDAVTQFRDTAPQLDDITLVVIKAIA
jgi:serine phosphatase RsbU (regulator of sigma subunit)